MRLHEGVKSECSIYEWAANEAPTPLGAQGLRRAGVINWSGVPTEVQRLSIVVITP